MGGKNLNWRQVGIAFVFASLIKKNFIDHKV
jgi:hypothetical protein